MVNRHWLTQTQDENMTVGVGPTDRTALQGATATRLLTLHAVVRKVDKPLSLPKFELRMSVLNC